jgi:hypothetical protein
MNYGKSMQDVYTTRLDVHYLLFATAIALAISDWTMF